MDGGPVQSMVDACIECMYVCMYVWINMTVAFLRILPVSNGSPPVTLHSFSQLSYCEGFRGFGVFARTLKRAQPAKQSREGSAI
jgi:hypothetical protein